MKQLQEKLDGWPSLALGALVLFAVAFYAAYSFKNLEAEKEDLLAELETVRESNYDLMKIIDEREESISEFQTQVQSLAGTVGTLEKLTQTDEELLAKYSKVYFLNENYAPKKLTPIPERYLSKGATNRDIHAQVWPYLERLLIEAWGEGHKLLIASAFRSFETQSQLKNGYVMTYGSGANRFSADQGYSEHQLGTTVDFTTEKLGANFSQFASEEAYQWLLDNAHRYGFILSYPHGNSYYKFEPWHWRFVGVNLASRLKDDDMHFYDLSQRDIDRYLIKLFD